MIDSTGDCLNHFMGSVSMHTTFPWKVVRLSSLPFGASALTVQ